MKRVLGFSSIFVWIAGVMAIYLGKIAEVPDYCADGDTEQICRDFFYLYFSLYALFLISYAFFVYVYGALWRFTIILLFALPALFQAQNFTALELSAIQVHSYEPFKILFYLWAIFLFIFFLASALFERKRKLLTKIFLLVTIICSIFFAFNGRGSAEHITPIIGGLLAEISLENFQLAEIPEFIFILAIMAFIAATGKTLKYWITHGVFRFRQGEEVLKTSGYYMLIALIPILSIPPGVILNKSDVSEAKQFIDSITPKVKDYYEKNKEYPKLITQVIEKETKVPRLIANYEYLVFNEKGAYYLSRPEKYCFIFQDPGKDFGYYSITSDRAEWKFFSETSSLDEQYLSICGEDGPGSHEGLVAGHLGLPSPDDPVSEINLKVLDKVNRPAITPKESEELEKVLEEMGKQDPSIIDPSNPPLEE